MLWFWYGFSGCCSLHGLSKIRAPSSTDMLGLPGCKPRPLEMLYDRWSRRDRNEQSAG